MSAYKIFIPLVFNRECMEGNVMTSFRILSSFEFFLRYFQAEWSVFFTVHCKLFTSCNVSNNASLVSARTGGRGVVNQMWTGLDRGRGVPKIPKFVGTSLMDDPKVNKTDMKRCKSSIFIADLFAWNTFWLIFILVSIIHAINIAIIFCIIRKCSKKLIHYFLPLD